MNINRCSFTDAKIEKAPPNRCITHYCSDMAIIIIKLFKSVPGNVWGNSYGNSKEKFLGEILYDY